MGAVLRAAAIACACLRAGHASIEDIWADRIANPTASSQFIEQIFRVAVGLYLPRNGAGLEMAAAGATFGATVFDSRPFDNNAHICFK
ncbi:MAG: hypothetical protein ACLTK0_10595 [Anaerovoracaceae bacterium]